MKHNDEQLDIDDVPPFPDDVATVPLLRISLEKLTSGDKGEIDRMWQACREIGFFYLDLRTTESAPSSTPAKRDSAHSQQQDVVSSQELLSNANDLFSVAKEFFSLPLDEKLKYDFHSINSYFGYKRMGQNPVDEEGNPDRNEFYNTAKDFVLGIREPLPEPELLLQSKNRRLLESFILQSHAVTLVILDILNDKLGLKQDELRQMHSLRAVSGDQVRFVQSPPQPESDRKKALGEHTDFGSVTLLFNKLGGLQVLLPDTAEWQYVRPLKHHCIVNLGDALVKFSAGILHSNMHRVVNPPGEQGNLTRLSLVYFSRPNDDVLLRPLESKMIARQKPEEEEYFTAEQWIQRRALLRKPGTERKQ